MPHFILDCSESVLQHQPPDDLLRAVYDEAEATGLFAKGDIKVRINSFHYYTVGKRRQDFIHIIAYIMEGRSTAQKAGLSKGIISRLKKMFPSVPVISIDVRDIDKQTYCNKTMV